TLAVFVPAIALAHALGLTAEVEGASRLGRSQERERPLLVLIHVSRGPHIVQGPRSFIDMAQQLAPARQTPVQFAVSLQAVNHELVLTRVAVDGKRRVVGAEKAGVLAG